MSNPSVKSNALKASVGITLLVAANAANAALPTDAATAFNDLGTYITDMIAAVWKVAVPLTVGFIGIKLFKKGANKAT